jgi:DNA-directed RNA polymerase subunit RPC12/RpoP
MTIDEVIIRYKNNAEYERTHGNLQGCLEFRQLAEWLKDYKRMKEQEPCEDAVSRQTVLDIDFNRIIHTTAKPVEMIRQKIKQLPSVNPQPKTGHWFIDERPESDRETICSNCEQPIFKYHKLDFDYRPKYCPNCGTKMVEPRERSDKE